MSETLLFIIVFGSIFILNCISLVCVRFCNTDYWNLYNTPDKKTFFIIYMLIVGFLFYPTLFIGKIIEKIHGN